MSHVMKSLERLVLRHLRTVVRPSLDPLQFTYQPQIGMEDAIIFLLHRAYIHLEEAGSTVRDMLFDFSSAFNTIQPALLKRKLLGMQVDAPLAAWTTTTSQAGRSSVRSSATCRSFLMTLPSWAVSAEARRRSTGSVVDRFVEWCGLNHLQLNVTKTKELVVDLRKQRTRLNSVVIRGTEADIVDSYKYLGVHLDNKLDWTTNTDAIYKKGQSRLFFLRRLRSFNVYRTMLQIFYNSVVSSVIFYAVVCWGSSLKTADTTQ
ncbi:hypothetical protein L3Q82_010384 [Scortum barcoo]|uniref:Uncharacterized protein n=1 Tax=Scortum barcoo TaxID=214431 RepID=A0ACB8WCG9_9TELE|nr:hypothetical protein L3Q82_010384 [Scortum barcoo]